MKQLNRAEMTATLVTGAHELHIELNDAQIEKLLDYLALLIKWNGVYNLTAIRDPAQMVIQHLLDSLAVAPAFSKAKNVLDVGAGAGLPGIVLAIWAADAHPDMRVSMIDPVHKKTAFLTQVKAELNLQNVAIYTARAEQIQVNEKFDVITSRAFAELKDFVNWSEHLLTENGRFIAMKGIVPTEEIERLPTGWQVTHVEKLHVPELQAERHLIIIQKNTALQQ